MPEDEFDPLAPDVKDALAASGRALAGLIPMFGGVVGEVISKLPGQRMDRIVQYIRELEADVERLELTLEAILADPERIDLIEEGAFQAARAISPERIEQIARLVANGLAIDDASGVRRKRLAALLRELDDDELLILNAYGASYGTGDHSAWDKIYQPDPAHLQSSMDEIDAEKLFESGKDHLLRLGLLKKNFGSVRRGESPEFDTSSGDFKHRVEISYLGRMLLRAIGKPSPYDVG